MFHYFLRCTQCLAQLTARLVENYIVQVPNSWGGLQRSLCLPFLVSESACGNGAICNLQRRIPSLTVTL
jgi:hypothetical protein